MVGPCWAGVAAAQIGPGLGAGGGPGVAGPTEVAREKRITKLFDFDEPNNFESVPMHWVRLEGPGLPHFADGHYDFQQGQPAPPSFYLNMNGRNVAFRYKANDIRARPNGDYLITARIKPDRLESGRAYVTAYYMDRLGRIIESTERRSSLIHDRVAPEGWATVTIELPPSPPEAFSVGITLWAVQSPFWRQGEPSPGTITLRDIDSGAWFDDIAVYRLPAILIEASSPSNLFIGQQTPTLGVRIGDPDGYGVTGRLTVRTATGEIVHEGEVPISAGFTETPKWYDLPDLPYGLYEAQLDVTVGQPGGNGQPINRRLRFVRVADRLRKTTGTMGRFGVVLTPPLSDSPGVQRQLIAGSLARTVKVPLWDLVSAINHPGDDDEDRTLWLTELLQGGTDLVAVIGDPPIPSAQRGSAEGARSKQFLIDILSSPGDSWKDYISPILATQAFLFHFWQIGADASGDIIFDPRLGPAVDGLRQAISSWSADHVLVAPGLAEIDPSTFKIPADIVSLTIGPHIHPDWIASHVDRYRQDGASKLWAYVPPLESQHYERLPRLANFAQRLIATLASSVDRVYVPQPWEFHAASGTAAAQPDEEYLVFRTICDLLGDAAPAGQVSFGPHCQGYVFDREGDGILALWNSHAPAGGAEYEVELGHVNNYFDLWGDIHKLPVTGDKQRVTLTSMPILIDGVQTWLLQFRDGLKLVPPRMTFLRSSQEHAIEIHNPRDEAISGEITLVPPENWDARPNSISFSLQPGQRVRKPVQLTFNPAEVAGAKRLLLEISLDATRVHRLTVPLDFELALDDLDVWGVALRLGDQVVLQHGATNLSDHPITLQSVATAPQRQRERRTLGTLQPGATVLKEYQFDHAADLAGQTVRLKLEEVNGPRLHNIELTVP